MSYLPNFPSRYDLQYKDYMNIENSLPKYST